MNEKNLTEKHIMQYIFLNNGIFKLNSSVFPSSGGYILQYGLYVNVINEQPNDC